MGSFSRSPMNNPLPPSKPQTNKKTTPRPQGFVEAFKEIGKGVGQAVKKDLWEGTVKEAGQQAKTLLGTQPSGHGTLPENRPLKLDELLHSHERKVRLQERRLAEIRRQEEKVVYSRREQEIKLQVKALQEELQKLAKTTQGLSREVEKAAFETVVSPGVYHLNFFERLRRWIASFRKKIAQSQLWLQEWNRRAEKRSVYWARVKKHGNKYLLSQERYMATQAG